ncbi:GNAT family N-acetyltransferase [Actinomyces polynesiensis]|uniref:GNAT family N-acetyltransferase n=1 Tax=Actinomyces polynesiensis TaxID=1325934 RepID=UPI000A9C3FAE|nr:GNAT family N-acetyltransferase [Actinomyces polynesiensis]
MSQEVRQQGAPISARVGAPLQLPVPPSTHGILWERLTADHSAALSNLFARIEATDNPPYRTSRDEVVEMLGPTGQWRGLAGYATRGIAKGQMVAYGLVGVRIAGHVECVCQGGVDPRFRRLGLGRSMIEWQTATARQMLATNPGQGSAQIVMHVETGHEELEDHLESLGYHWARTYYELRADLEVLPAPPDLGSYLSVVPWSEDLEDLARRASNRLSEQEWGRPPQSMEQWLMGRTGFVPEWSFVVMDRTGDRPQVAGFLLASRYEQDWAALGWREGYIDQMGVLQPWRHTRVADALIVASMTAQRRDGMDRAAAGLGSANHSGALVVYDSLGFRTVGQSRLYAINV